MNERLLGEAIRAGIAAVVKPLSDRVEVLEGTCSLNSQRRLMDAHICGQLFQHMVDKELVSAEELKGAIKDIGRSIKRAADDDWDMNRLVDEHISEWTERIGD